VKRLVEHRELKASPTVLLSDTSIAPSEDPKAPITLMRLLVAAGPMKEDALVRNIFKVVAFCSALAFITAILTWGVTIAR
jgi:UDP-N-acetylglucosamine--dolichyl-phosphate N-acetylglucosaminephosphotransferase